MAKNLFIVESPAKAKTIEGFLGKDYTVKSSIGHIRDLVKKGMGVDLENNFKPSYEISPDKKKVVDELKKLAKTAETVWLATDEDREGEAIAWHLFEALDLDNKKTKRIVYNEITKKAIESAIANPRKIDINLVNAQQARRVLDRLVGFELSPILWKKVKPSLSAGRVQSVAVRLIAEREKEINAFKSTSSYKVVALFFADGKKIVKAELPQKFATLEQAKQFLEKCKGAAFAVQNLETKPAKKSPSAPFTTSTLQQEASRKLGFSVSQTMVVAQKLYESGKITYMRTDSVNLSDTAIQQAKQEIGKNYGEKYIHTRQFKTKSKGAQEAHEAIRPTYLNVHEAEGDYAAQRLYDLIWKRTIASQMSDAELEKTTATISISTTNEKFIAQGEVLKFDGFLKVYMESSDEEEADEKENEKDDQMLPPLKIGQALNLNQVTATERFTHHPARYTEASLVKKLEELGIGRPSTYAPTISTVQKRGYVEKSDRQGKPRNYNVLLLQHNSIAEEIKTENTGAEKSKLFPTDLGMLVNDFLMEHFPRIMDYNFTATVEGEFDIIAEGNLSWTQMLKSFYKPFHETVSTAEEKSERVSGERILGEEPGTGKKVLVRIGRFGPMVQIGDSAAEEKPRYASLRKDQRLDTITFQEAMDLFKLPRKAGEFEEKDVTVAIGRFGPYVRHDNKFASLRKEDDPMTVSLERCIELIEAKRVSDANRLIKIFPQDPEMKVLKGRWGAYLALGKKNFRLPKGTDPASLTYEDCLKIMGPSKPKEEKEEEKAKKVKAKIKPPVKKAKAVKPVVKKKAAVKKTAKKK